jgi:excisionase family DNA binding protein
LLGRSVDTTYVYLADGTIPAKRVGRRWIVSRARLDTWLTAGEEGR